MPQRYTSRPTPAVSIIGAIVGVIMLFVGIGFFSQAEAPPGSMAIFVVVWFVVLIGAIAYHIANATRPEGVPTEIIEAQDGTSKPRSTAERLQELDDLRNRKLISDAEYDAKRQDILKEL